MDAHKKQPAGQSKYDLVKVKVWLGEHYYILSRFLISRMLTVTKIPYIKAVKIALELKKFFVDREELDISQPDLEEALFQIMHSRGFGDDYIRRYKMVTKFFQQKRPLIILLCGVSCTGKSTFAQQLASRLNLPNVLQTDVIYELLQLAGHCQAPKTAAHNSPPLDPQQIIAAFQRQCRDVRRGIDGDLTKSIRDGKPIIIEGLHLDPGLYLYEFGKYGVAHLLREHRKLQRSLSAHEVAFFLQRSSAPSTLSLSQASFQQKLAGALTSKSFDSGPAHQSSEFLQAVSMPPPMQQGPNSDAAGGTSEEMSGRSPASEWLQQFVPCFSGRQPQAAVTAPAPEATSRPDLDASASGSESWSHAPQGLLTSAVQQQPAQAVLGRGQLFHCWRRKSGPMTATSAGPAAAASARANPDTAAPTLSIISESRRASPHSKVFHC
ncbi:hypothetical protein WJX84_002161 [Apatococcus fuscideae]|uniref:2-phosphoglycerate kinase n=1 Tax=Apatococcus fuscideae TaxID=2026836 RepID=A0AAW1T368_9CHLO